ncbi:MAG: ACT domain-containing protein [Euryarchaeota archaeon]|nr:ACT domain-containing protein [Euryarchaeota archaeon]
MTREFVITLENKPGTLATVAKALGSANINILGFALQPQGEFGTFRFVTNEETKTEGWLKTSGHRYRANECVTTRVRNTPGELGRICDNLSRSGVNVEACYPLAPPSPSETELCFTVDDVNSAKKVLGH